MQQRLALAAAAGGVALVAILFDLRDMAGHRFPAFDLALFFRAQTPAPVIAAIPLESPARKLRRAVRHVFAADHFFAPARVLGGDLADEAMGTGQGGQFGPQVGRAPRFGSDEGLQSRMIRRIDNLFKDELAAGSVIKDEDASVTIYTQIGGDEDRMHKKLHILDARGPREIVELSKVIKELAEKRRFVRYYFAKEIDRDRARALGEGRMT